METIQEVVRFADREFVESDEYINAFAPMQSAGAHLAGHVGTGAAYLNMFIEEVSHRAYPSFAGVTDFEKVALVYFRGSRPHMQDTELKRLVQVPLYPTEIKPYRPLSQEHMQLRIKFAQMTGFLLLGPDECFAALHGTNGKDAYTFCEVVENNDLGIPRSVDGLYADGVDYWSQPVTISDLDATRTKSKIRDVMGSYYMASRMTAVYSEQQRERFKTAFQLLEEHQKVAPPERSEFGSKVFRTFIENGDTSKTREMRPSAEGWRRYPNYQDAWYFGIWFNPEKLEILTYAEGDVIHVVSENIDQFNCEMASMARRYGREPSPSMMGISKDEVVFMFDCLSLFSRVEGKVVTLNFSKDCAAQDADGNLILPLLADLLTSHPSIENLEDGLEVELTKAVFQLNLLDPRTFEQSWTAKALRQGSQIRVTLQGGNADQIFDAVVDLS